MAVELATAYISLVPSAKGIGNNIAKEIGGPAEDAGRTAGKRMLGGFSPSIGGLAAAASGALAAVGVGSILKDSIEEAREAAKVTRQTEAVIKSTGGVAGVTAGHIGDLATKLSNLSGIDDELIQSGENVLATFTNIRNGVGKGNDVFDQATTAALNMSAALGQDMQSSVIQVGKALNDPIKGVTALSRVGVSFTEDQKKQIKTLVESGKSLEAQKIILNELGKEFGGAAAASADPMQKLGVVFKNLEEQLGTALLPVIEKLATFLGAYLPGAINTASAAIGTIIGYAKQIFNILFKGDFTGGPFAEDSKFVDTLFNIRDAFQQKVLPVIKKVSEFIRAHLKPVLIGLGIAVVALIGPWLLVVGVIAAVVAAVVKAYNRFTTFRDTVQQVVEVATSLFGALQAVVQRVVVVVTNIWDRFGNTLVGKLRIAANALIDVVQGLLKILSGVFDLIKAILTGKWGEAWDAIKEILAGAWDAIGGIVRLAIDALATEFEAAKALLSAAWAAVWHAIHTVLVDIWGGIESFIGGKVEWVVALFQKIPGWVGQAFKTLAEVITAPYRIAFKNIAKLWNNTLGKISFTIPGWVPGIGGKGFHFPKIDEDLLKFHSGGVVPGRPGQEVLAVLKAGETVIPAGRGAGSGLTMPITINGVDAETAVELLHRKTSYRLRTLAV